MKKLVKLAFKESSQVVNESARNLENVILDVIEASIQAIESGNKIMVCGNGGSAADAQHFVGELVNRLMVDREPLPGLALSTDTSTMTSIANDYGYDQIFAKQVKALGKKGDILYGISTSGNSRNVIEAVKVANELEIFTVSLTGSGGGKLKDFCKLNIIVPDSRVMRIQEVHLLTYHTISEAIENYFYNKGRGNL